MEHLTKWNRFFSAKYVPTSKFYCAKFVRLISDLISLAGVDTNMRFSIEPYPGDSGFSQWHDAMRMVARLPGGIPQEFRKKVIQSQFLLF